MVSKRKALAPLLVALGVALGVFGLLIPDAAGTVAAQATPSATRSLSATSSVAPGAEITVTINASNTGQFRWHRGNTARRVLIRFK